MVYDDYGNLIDDEDFRDEDMDFDDEFWPDEYEDGMTDVEADADTLRSAGYGTDEDYEHYLYDEFGGEG